MSIEDINELKTLLFQDRLTNYGKRKMINYYENETTRQKQINEEHQKINGELREKVKELEEENKKKSIELICLQDELDNSIPKQVVKEVLQNNRNGLFGMTYLSKEQYKTCEMQIKRINKIEQELLGGEK